MMCFEQVLSTVSDALAMDHARVRTIAVAMRQQGLLDHRADAVFDLGQAIVIMVTAAATEQFEDLVRAATVYVMLPLQRERAGEHEPDGSFAFGPDRDAGDYPIPAGTGAAHNNLMRSFTTFLTLALSRHTPRDPHVADPNRRWLTISRDLDAPWAQVEWRSFLTGETLIDTFHRDDASLYIPARARIVTEIPGTAAMALVAAFNLGRA